MIASEVARIARHQSLLQYALFALLLIAATGMRLHEVGIVTLYSKDEVSYTRLAGIALTQGISGMQAEPAVDLVNRDCRGLSSSACTFD